MKTYDQISSLFWLLLSASVCIESIRLGIGTARHPDMGFMSFGASVLLGILSLTLFLQGIWKKKEVKPEPLFAGKLWKRVLFALVAILVYAKWMPLAGYLISTFLLMSFLFWIAQVKKWWRIFVLSFLTTLITYYVFSVWLKCQFPEGLFGL